jgi:thiopurine S-methyltransferase
METAFWRQRWQDNQIGFHQERPTPLLLRHWPAVGVQPGSRVFLPLCGKSLDLVWFAAQGYRVLGVELSILAVERFFAEQDLQAEFTDSRLGRHFRSGPIEIICGDAFALDERTLADCDAVFDRAALIALPETMRRRYVDELYARLPTDCRGLLITLEYPQDEKRGPPFSVVEREVRERFEPQWQLDVLERSAILAQQPAFIADGVSALDTVVYRLARR